MDQVTVEEEVPRVLPGSHICQDSGHLVLDVDTWGYIVGEEEDLH